MPYTQLPPEEYVKTLHGYNEQEIENVLKVRSEWEYMSWQQFQLLFEQGQIRRLKKLKKPRSLYFNEETGGFYYLNHYHRNFEKMAEFKE